MSFNQAYGQVSEGFPVLPVSDQELAEVAVGLHVPIDSADGVLSAITKHAIERWLTEDSMYNPYNLQPYQQAPEHRHLGDIGLLGAVAPRRARYAHALVDGGSRPIFEYRLNDLDKRLQAGLFVSDVTLFAGQRVRMKRDDLHGSLEEVAHGVLDKTESTWARRWIHSQLYRDGGAPDPWKRPFATEHEVAVLELLHRYEGLEHSRTIERGAYASAHEAIPTLDTMAEEFVLDGRAYRVLNAPAIIREFRGNRQPLTEARPTVASCFREWNAIVGPDERASVLFSTNNPEVYRSWLNVSTEAYRDGRADLYLEATGAAIGDRTYGYLLRAFAKLMIDFQNHAQPL
jgi:hypothetical protein